MALPDPFFDSYGERAFSLYIHVPFCEQKCAYCDFFTITDPAAADSRRAPWLPACLAEFDLWLERYPELHTRPLGTIYFGGGTPSSLPARAIVAFLDGLRQRVNLDPGAEITLEIQPNTLHPADFAALSDAGINRWSIGAQTFQPAVLASTHRRHSPEHTVQAIQSASTTTGTVGVDLIAHLPGCTLEDFLDDLRRAASIGAAHLSTYDLTYHDGTEWERAVRAGRIQPPTDDERADWQEAILHDVDSLGFTNYEVSNHARPGRESRHNCSYWECADSIGLGAGAHTHFGGARLFNPPQADAYLRAIQSGRLYAREFPAPSPEVLLVENLHMALRKATGVHRARFTRRFQHDPLLLCPGFWADLRDQALADWDQQRLWLTQKGRLRTDGITESLVTRIKVGQDQPGLGASEED